MPRTKQASRLSSVLAEVKIETMQVSRAGSTKYLRSSRGAIAPVFDILLAYSEALCLFEDLDYCHPLGVTHFGLSLVRSQWLAR